MRHEPMTDDPEEEKAALYLAGALDAEGLAAFEAELDSGSAASALAIDRLAPAAEAMARAIPEVPPSPEVKRRLMEQLAAPGTGGAVTDSLLRRVAEADWSPTPLPGIWIRVLRPRDAQGRITALVRMEPGAVIPPHQHPGDEEIFLLEGDLIDHGCRMGPGDYLHSPAGTAHGASRSETGCVSLVIATFSLLLPR